MADSLKHQRRRHGRFLLGIALYLAFGSLAWAEENPWQALRSGTAVGLLRHALAPGVGDPAHSGRAGSGIALSGNQTVRFNISPNTRRAGSRAC